MNKIILTGGGTAGHVNPNLALVPRLQQTGWQIEYIGSQTGIERQLVTTAGIPYHSIASGKLRRYFDWQNLVDPFKVVKGIADAYMVLARVKPNLVFSKGGFVTVPVVLAAWLQRIPVIIHESDFSPGLANRLALPFASKVCITFPETQKFIPQAICTGLPIRAEVLGGDRAQGQKICGFKDDLPVLLVIGGSLGSAKLNQAIRQILPQLLSQYQVVHLCGQGHFAPNLVGQPGYIQFEYLHQDLAHIYALADLVVSRAGANAIFELVSLAKPHLLIPLSLQSSRGDQILNANSFAAQGYSRVLAEEQLVNCEDLLGAIADLSRDQARLIAGMRASQFISSIDKIIQLICQTAQGE
ncbi:MAG: undecaprenyldiphospho-muramoylpentapeptide beta-N-acetylglucosaminyltransferase [Pseudanabaenaceae cyanobacterium bins.68]|nr:undecaprenyldiphospho-muramoylpentapeptide beta-N-acetylglucosaminyltransferase [Pseudanabaenaceae cyanobacterium bins.68]